jgi:hypothetical protein
MAGSAETADLECVANQETVGMTHGRSAERGKNPRTKNVTTPLTGFSKESNQALELLIASLEARLADLEVRVDRLDGIAPAYYYGIADDTKRKPGPGKKISDSERLHNRDALVNWLEANWPTIAGSLRTAKNALDLAAVFEGVAETEQLQPPWQSTFLAHPSELLDFLRSKKFKIKPPKRTALAALNRPYDDQTRKRAANRLPSRQIANAMAGVPKLKWRTSLDLCQNKPSDLMIAGNAVQHYRMIYDIPEADPNQPKRRKARTPVPKSL